MTLQERILQNKKEARDTPTKAALNVIVGEMQRQLTKDLTDPQVVAILKKLVKYEEERLKHCVSGTITKYLEVLKSYLPEQVTEEEVIAWIKNNVVFSTLKNKMQAVGLVTKHFGPKVDGQTVKRIIEEKC